MAKITDATLTITHDHTKKLARVVVRRKVNFTALELCQMKTCKEAGHFKLRCELWGEDDGFFDRTDNLLFTYSNVFYYPDATPTTARPPRSTSRRARAFWTKTPGPTRYTAGSG